MRIKNATLVFISSLLFSLYVNASGFEIRAELGDTLVFSNYFRVPQAATRVDFPADKREVTGRLYGTWNLDDENKIRVLIAPFSTEAQITPTTPIEFQGRTFSAGTPLDIDYKFNSYRVSYIRQWTSEKAFRPHVGFTAKIRDAEIKLKSGGVEANRANVGFVPLLNLGFHYIFSEHWLGYFDLDAAAASEGRALDGIVEMRYQGFEAIDLGLGYRVLDGGVDTESNENFAQLRTWLLSVTKAF